MCLTDATATVAGHFAGKEAECLADHEASSRSLLAPSPILVHVNSPECGQRTANSMSSFEPMHGGRTLQLGASCSLTWHATSPDRMSSCTVIPKLGRLRASDQLLEAELESPTDKPRGAIEPNE